MEMLALVDGVTAFYSPNQEQEIDSTLFLLITLNPILTVIEDQEASFHLDSNGNLSHTQLERLSWHYCLGHVGINALQQITHHRKPR